MRKPDEDRIKVLLTRKLAVEESWGRLLNFLSQRRYEYLPHMQGLFYSLQKLPPDYFRFEDLSALEELHSRATFDFEQLLESPLDDAGKYRVWKREGELEAILRSVRKRTYVAKYDLREFPMMSVCARKILGKRCVAHDDSCLGPGADHWSSFKSARGSELVMVMQPYADITDSSKLTMDCIVWAASKGLAVRFSVDESWHSFGRTLLIEYRKKAVRP
jgi:hypothetical protein